MSKWKTHRVVIELPIRGNISEQDFKHFIKELCNEHVSLDRLPERDDPSRRDW
jgi:hypothetical protein